MIKEIPDRWGMTPNDWQLFDISLKAIKLRQPVGLVPKVYLALEAMKAELESKEAPAEEPAAAAALEWTENEDARR